MALYQVSMSDLLQGAVAPLVYKCLHLRTQKLTIFKSFQEKRKFENRTEFDRVSED